MMLIADLCHDLLAGVTCCLLISMLASGWSQWKRLDGGAFVRTAMIIQVATVTKVAMGTRIAIII